MASVDEASDGPGGSAEQGEETFDARRAILLASVAALGGFLFGFDTAVVNGAVDAVESQFKTGAVLIGFVVSLALLGCAVGAYAAGWLADRVGRIKVMVLAAVLFFISAIGSGLAFGPWDLMAWRVIGGLGVGAASVIAPAYIAEIAPASIRGRLGSLQQLAIVTGIFVALLSDAFIARIAGGASAEAWLGLSAWRWMFLVGTIPALAYGLLSLTIPESPRYLISRGQTDKAREILSQVITSGVAERMKEIRRTVALESRSSFKDLIKPGGGGLLPIVWIGILLSVFQQFVGINVIFYYSTTLWQAVGFSEKDSFTASVITSVINVLVTIVAIALIDRIGRRKLLLIGSAGMFVSLATLSIAFSRATTSLDGQGHVVPHLGHTAGIVALIAANLFVIFFGVSWGPAVWVLLGEIFNNKIRAAALGLAAGAQWVANFAISVSFPKMADFSLTFSYAFYAFFAFVSFFFVWKFVNETRGRQLEDME